MKKQTVFLTLLLSLFLVPSAVQSKEIKLFCVLTWSEDRQHGAKFRQIQIPTMFYLDKDKNYLNQVPFSEIREDVRLLTVDGYKEDKWKIRVQYEQVYGEYRTLRLIRLDKVKGFFSNSRTTWKNGRLDTMDDQYGTCEKYNDITMF